MACAVGTVLFDRCLTCALHVHACFNIARVPPGKKNHGTYAKRSKNPCRYAGALEAMARMAALGASGRRQRRSESPPLRIAASRATGLGASARVLAATAPALRKGSRRVSDPTVATAANGSNGDGGKGTSYVGVFLLTPKAGSKGKASGGGPAWRAQVDVNGKKKFLGSFASAEAAARAYDAAAAQLGRRLNFPPDGAAQAVKRRTVPSAR